MITIIEYTRQKVYELFEMCPDKVHGFDHAERVAEYAEYISAEEGVESFLPILAGLFHDIGRAVEKYPQKFFGYDSTKTHHELSYDMLKNWFREDEGFSMLSDGDKIKLLYAVRNHCNDEADEYPVAYILRDADKIDGLGVIGLEREIEYTKNNLDNHVLNIRLHYEWSYHLKTKTAIRIFEEGKLLEPFHAHRKNLLKKEVKSVEL